MVALALNACVLILALPYGILAGILLPAAFGLLADTGELGQAINPSNALKLMRANVGGYVVAWLLNSFIHSLASSIGSIACGVGAFPALAYGMAVIGHVFGQAYRVAQPGDAIVEARTNSRPDRF